MCSAQRAAEALGNKTRKGARHDEKRRRNERGWLEMELRERERGETGDAAGTDAKL